MRGEYQNDKLFPTLCFTVARLKLCIINAVHSASGGAVGFPHSNARGTEIPTLAAYFNINHTY